VFADEFFQGIQLLNQIFNVAGEESFDICPAGSPFEPQDDRNFQYRE